MAGLTLKQAQEMIPGQAARLLDCRVEDVVCRPWDEAQGDELPPERLPSEGMLAAGGRVFRPDLVLETSWLKLVIVWRAASGVANILLAVRHLSRHWPTRTVPVLVVPYMGGSGARLCAEENVSWFDLSGNAALTGPGVHVHIEGKRNRHQRRGRPSSCFAARSVRVVRWLLIHPERRFQQKELTAETGLDPGFVSRILRPLEEKGFVQRDGRQVWCAGPADLLRAWQDTGARQVKKVIAGRLAGVAQEERLTVLAHRLQDRKLTYGVTGQGAAQPLAGAAAPDRVEIYLPKAPGSEDLQAMGLEETPDGDIALLVPKDDGVLQGAQQVQGITCVHPVQAYVDIRGQGPEVEQARQRVWERCLGF